MLPALHDPDRAALAASWDDDSYFCGHPDSQGEDGTGADLWEDELNNDVAVLGSPPETESVSSFDGSIDIVMESGSLVSMPTLTTEDDNGMIYFMGRDGNTFQCSANDIADQSQVLFDMINVGGRLVRLPLPADEVELLVNSLRDSFFVHCWANSRLKLLVRAVELFVHYGICNWDREGIERTMIACLKEHWSPDDAFFEVTRYDLTDASFTERLRSLALRQNMVCLCEQINLLVPYCDQEEDRPRKWRKCSAKYVCKAD
ncbi:3-hydroxyisobutyrate dehydrogenase, mitochondrial precursor [Pseudozyma hubeiensis SY62]|uniref:3-hydroxyisobutyrate dehydrogenase, mitochondrial n=1 Tax=Pseudozyma hubeiensis (strain SY62) TaxID=1305764 RepID=R9P776_PSEHS|nr:3-hydroxyisobutyrate dehydrogenase, mitochondrial precursor [Pseudozyma hubeiensis SY62]GAC97248.1 3-hydroxyisobutyrate dehydrogenase, mitochondrial precursor [Pseudozyma hubeiensis SY62]